MLQLHDIVLGFPHWPAKIYSIYGSRNQMVEVWWFNDYRRTKMQISQMSNFFQNYEKLKPTFTNRIGLETAVKEAIIYMGEKMKN